MEALRFASCMAPNADGFARAVSEYVAARTGIPIAVLEDVPWPERERQLDRGEVHLCWLCGLPYVWKADRRHPRIELLAAPVMQAAHYEQRPVYFSDVVVHRDGAFHSFADLRGARWAYNEPRSHSGYNVVRHHLAMLGEPGPYFGKLIESGAHQRSLEMILSREVDVSAIDSTILETELRRDPSLGAQLRIIDRLGPSPAPPWVVSRQVDDTVRHALREVLLGMHEDPEGQAILAASAIARFAAVSDRDYDPIRHMDQQARRVHL